MLWYCKIAGSNAEKQQFFIIRQGHFDAGQYLHWVKCNLFNSLDLQAHSIQRSKRLEKQRELQCSFPLHRLWWTSGTLQRKPLDKCTRKNPKLLHGSICASQRTLQFFPLELKKKRKVIAKQTAFLHWYYMNGASVICINSFYLAWNTPAICPPSFPLCSYLDWLECWHWGAHDSLQVFYNLCPCSSAPPHREYLTNPEYLPLIWSIEKCSDMLE